MNTLHGYQVNILNQKKNIPLQDIFQDEGVFVIIAYACQSESKRNSPTDQRDGGLAPVDFMWEHLGKT